MRLDSVQFIHTVNYFGQQLQGASTTNVGDRPGQPPFEIELAEHGGMPSVKLVRERGTLYVPIFNVASYRASAAAQTKAGK